MSGIAINLADQYLHPRTLATAAILAAIVAVIDRRLWLAGVLLAVAFSVHAIMAAFGISFCAFLWWNLRGSLRHSLVPAGALLLAPLGWIFEPSSDAWRQAAATRSFYFWQLAVVRMAGSVRAHPLLMFFAGSGNVAQRDAQRGLRPVTSGNQSSLLRCVPNRCRVWPSCSHPVLSVCGRLSRCATCICSTYYSF